MRNKTRKMQIGELAIGANSPVLIQSMLSLPWDRLAENVAQAKELEKAGCEILRVAIPTEKSVGLIPALKEAVSMPIVADIHFDWRLAMKAVAAGADKVRINPGNIGGRDRVKELAEVCGKNNIPIRIGVNSGSVEESILAKYGSPTAEAMVESALYHAGLLEEFDFHNIAVSMKSTHVPTMMKAYKLMAEQRDYPLHLGITHAGTPHMGFIKSVMGIGGLLAQGIGDTIRVSLTAPPIEEIAAAKDILKGAGLTEGIEIISCPTCGRASIDIIGLTQKVEEALVGYTIPITVAVMGCVVNGPGEAKEADLGITGGNNGKCVLFKKGAIVATVFEDEVIPALLKEIELLEAERGA